MTDSTHSGAFDCPAHETICRLYRDKIPIRQIAREMKCWPNTIMRIVERYGLRVGRIPGRKPGSFKANKLPDEKTQKRKDANIRVVKARYCAMGNHKCQRCKRDMPRYPALSLIKFTQPSHPDNICLLCVTCRKVHEKDQRDRCKIAGKKPNKIDYNALYIVQ